MATTAQALNNTAVGNITSLRDGCNRVACGVVAGTFGDSWDFLDGSFLTIRHDGRVGVGMSMPDCDD